MDHLHPVAFNIPGKKNSGLDVHSVPSVLLSPGSSASPTRILIEEQNNELDIDQEIQNEINLRILESKALEDLSRLPFWMRKYRLVSYFTYFLVTCFSIYYLIQIAIFQANPKMQIHYIDIVRYLEYNSYSILSPLLCPVMMGVLACHVRNRVNLEDGDFFGVLSVLLFFALVNIHDGYGVYRLSIQEKDLDLTTTEIDPPDMDLSSMNELHWQYAWSTSRACMKKYVRNLIYQHEYNGLVEREVLVDYQMKHERNFMDETNNQTNQTIYEGLNCSEFHEVPDTAKIKSWMTDLQEEGDLKCCGPYGYVEWVTRYSHWKQTGCKDGWKTAEGTIPGCYEKLMHWYQPLCVKTYWIMFVQGLLYIVSGVLAVVHHSAMKLTARVLVKQYSLLNMTDKKPMEDPWWRQARPIDKPQIIGKHISRKSEPDAAEPWEDREMRRSNHNKWNKSRERLVAINSAVTVISLHSKKPESEPKKANVDKRKNTKTIEKSK